MPQTEVDHSVTQDTIPTEDTNNASPLLTYVLNTSTKRFHSEFCKSISKIADKNKREIVTTRDEVLAMGYTPCGNCHP